MGSEKIVKKSKKGSKKKREPSPPPPPKKSSKKSNGKLPDKKAAKKREPSPPPPPKKTSKGKEKKQRKPSVQEDDIFKWGFTLGRVYRTAVRFYKDKEGRAFNLAYNDKVMLAALTKQVAYGPISKCKKLPEIGYFDWFGNDRQKAWTELGNMKKNHAMEELIHLVDKSIPVFSPFMIAQQKEEEKEERIRREEEERKRLEEQRRREDEEYSEDITEDSEEDFSDDTSDLSEDEELT